MGIPDRKRITIPSLELQLTDTCQNNCWWCANGDGPEKEQTLSLKLLQETFRRIYTKTVIFSGGEPTARMDLLTSYIRIARSACAKTVKINTNMELLTSERLSRLEKAGLNVVHFALNTMEPEKHRALRGNEHAEVARVLENIRIILEQTHLRLKPEFVCLRETIEDFWEIYNYLNNLHSSYPGRFEAIELQRLVKTGRACHALSPEISKIAEIISRKIIGELKVDALCFGNEGAHLASYGINAFRCTDPTNCGCSPIRVDVNGGVSKTNFSNQKSVFNIMDIPDGGIERLLSSPCPAPLDTPAIPLVHIRLTKSS